MGNNCRICPPPPPYIHQKARKKISLLYFQSYISEYTKVSSRPPSTLPILGNALTFLQPRHNLLDWFTHCSRQGHLSTYEISVPGLPPGIVVNDVKNVEYILRNDDVFIKGGFVKSRSWDLFGA